jgi:hypothetical protein
MFNSRSKNPAMDQLLSSVGKSARHLSDQIDTWASDGYEAVRGAAKSDAAFWGAISVGIGAAAGGLYALWRKTDLKSLRAARRQIATLSSEMMQSVRSAMPETLAFAGLGKRPTRKRRSRSSSQLNHSDGAAVMPLKAGTKRSRSMRSMAATAGEPMRKSSRKRSSSRRKKSS